LKVGLRALGFDIHKAEAQKLMHDYDRQGKNKITYQDFHEIGKYTIELMSIIIVCIAAEMMLQRDSRDEIQKAFKLFDDDESGKISLKKLRRVAR
jgi:centrin-3